MSLGEERLTIAFGQKNFIEDAAGASNSKLTGRTLHD